MSLATDAIFMAAIEADSKIMEMIGGRRWCTAAPMPEESFYDNVAVPFIIVRFDGFSTDQGTKDDAFDSGDDLTNISILIAANDNDELDDIAGRVRRAVHKYLTDHMGEAGVPLSTIPGGGQKSYDDLKPAYCVTLSWQCATSFDLTDQDDEQAD